MMKDLQINVIGEPLLVIQKLDALKLENIRKLFLLKQLYDDFCVQSSFSIFAPLRIDVQQARTTVAIASR